MKKSQPNHNYHIDDLRPTLHAAQPRMVNESTQCSPLSGPIQPVSRLGLLLLPALLLGSFCGVAQDTGVKFRGTVPLAPAVVPASSTAPAIVELPDPQPVLPGSKIIDPRMPAVPATTPAPAESPADTVPQLPDPAPVDKNGIPQSNPADVQVLPDPSTIRPPMPTVDVPQLDNVNLFPTNQQQLENAADESSRGWQLVTHGGLRATWDSNIFIQSKNEQSDFIISFSPGAAVGIGEFRQELATAGTFRDRFDRTDAELGRRYFYLDYNPSYHLYTSNGDESSFEQDIRAEARYTFTKLTLGATARYETLNIADADLGEKVGMSRFQSRINADYALTGKTTLEVQLDHNIRNYEGNRNDITEYRATGWVDYQVLPKTNVALGYTHGWVDVTNSSNQSFDQVQLRAVWKTSAKLAVKASGGMEFRTIDNRDDVTNATFAVGVIYNPFDATSIFLNGFRRTTTSASGFNETFLTTGFDVRVNQRFSQKYFFTAAGGLQSADYQENLITGITRADDYAWGRLSLGWDVNKWLTALLAYEYRQNDSSQENRSFEDHLFYIQFNFLF